MFTFKSRPCSLSVHLASEHIARNKRKKAENQLESAAIRASTQPLAPNTREFSRLRSGSCEGKKDAKTSKAAVIKALGLEQPSALKRQTIGVEEEVQDIDDQIAFFTMPRSDVVLHDDDLFEGIADLV